MSLIEIKKQSAEQLAADAVRDYILGGHIAPGARLTEAFLAERLSLSRATVRGALQRMSQEGLLVLVPYTGWEVMSITSHDAWELYTLRASLESLGARLASERIDGNGKTTLNQAYAQVVQACEAQDRKKISLADFNLHRTIIALSGHTRLAQQYQFVEQQISLYIMWSDFIPKNLHTAVIQNHGPIVQAILDGDGDKAAQLSAAHNVNAGVKLVKHLQELEQQSAALAR